MIVLAKRKNLIQIVLFMIAVIILIDYCDFPFNYSLRRVFIKVKPLKLPDFNDNVKDLKVKELFQLIDSDSNLALSYWRKWKSYKISNDWPGINFETCYTIIPWVEELKFNNIHWQVLSNGSKQEYYLLNAYYDDRQDEKLIKVIALRQRDAAEEIWCLEYFKNKRQPVKVKASLSVDRHKTAKYQLVIMNCPVPKFVGDLVPKAVSIINQNYCPAQVENSLRVIYEKPVGEQKEFAICHKALRFSEIDLSFRLIEWIEMQRILGVDMIQIYSLGIHPNMEKALKYYQDQGLVIWRKHTIPGEQPNIAHLYQKLSDTMGNNFVTMEPIDYYDCYYRNLYKYKMIGIFDLDEIIVPVKGYTLTELFNYTMSKPDFDLTKVANFEFQGPRFFSDIQNDSPDIKNYTYTLKHPYRGPFEKGEQHKSIHFTDKVKCVDHHGHCGCINGRKCQTYYIDIKDGYYLHYRIEHKASKKCPWHKIKECVFYDPIIYKYKDDLERNMEVALAAIYN